MSINEINSGNGLETQVGTAMGLPGGISDANRDLFGRPLSRSPDALASFPNFLSKSVEGRDGFAIETNVEDNLNTDQTSAYADASFAYGDEFESGIPPIDFAARQAGRVLDVVEKTVEERSPSVRKFINKTAAQLSEAIHEEIDTARGYWNAPDNELREAFSDRVQQGVGFLKKWVTHLSDNRDIREFMDHAIATGRNLVDKTGEVIQNAQVATESWLETAYNEAYIGNAFPNGQLSHSEHLERPFVGVIDTGFAPHGHGTQVVETLQQVSHQTPDWLADSVGTGNWATSLIKFVDDANAFGRPNAVINLSFDLTKVKPDGSLATRYELTAEEKQALAYAQDNGVLVVVSSGNQAATMSALGQASQTYDNVIAVGASKDGQRAVYSSYGMGLDFVSSGQGTDKVSGTSLSAARVAGAIAKIWDENPHLSYRQVIQSLEATATDLEAPGWDRETGYGQLNTVAALDLAETFSPQGAIASEPQVRLQGNPDSLACIIHEDFQMTSNQTKKSLNGSRSV
ncbi:MAG: S8 family serine peptidase [Cyanobacteria bacterium P01_G01_bin.38]